MYGTPTPGTDRPTPPDTGAPVVGPATPNPVSSSRQDAFERAVLVLAGLISVVLAVVVLAQPQLSVTGLLLLIGSAVALNSARSIVAGTRVLRRPDGGWSLPKIGRELLGGLSLLGVGVLAVVVAFVGVLDPGRAAVLAVFLMALALVAQGLGKIAEGFGRGMPTWLRSSSIATGAIVIVLIIATLGFEGFALVGFAILVGVILLVSGIETIVAGLRPTDPRQFVLLKLVLFAAFYGLVMINWIDLFGKEVPGYGIWLIMTYMAPFAVLLVFQGWESWPLAVSLGLLVSLMNDLGYFFIGNLLFGFHEDLGPWIAGQLGLRGNAFVTQFQGGSFSLTVTSWMMGLSIYARAAVVAIILYYWWRHPTNIVARSTEEPPAGPVRVPG